MSHKKIISIENPLIKKLKREAKKASLTLIENSKFIKDIINSSIYPEFILLTENRLKEFQEFFPAQLENKIIITSKKVIKYFSELITNQEIIAFFEPKIKPFYMKDLERNGIYIFLYEIQDPGNIGTITRTAAALNLSGIILTKGCANPFSLKAARSSAGACFFINIYKITNYQESLRDLKKAGYILIAAIQKGEILYYDLQYNFPFVLILGNEGSGLPNEILDYADYQISIPMNKIESLNVACCSSIILYEAYRQRMQKGE